MIVFSNVYFDNLACLVVCSNYVSLLKFCRLFNQQEEQLTSWFLRCIVYTSARNCRRIDDWNSIMVEYKPRLDACPEEITRIRHSREIV